MGNNSSSCCSANSVVVDMVNHDVVDDMTGATSSRASSSFASRKRSVASGASTIAIVPPHSPKTSSPSQTFVMPPSSPTSVSSSSANRPDIHTNLTISMSGTIGAALISSSARGARSAASQATGATTTTTTQSVVAHFPGEATDTFPPYICHLISSIEGSTAAAAALLDSGEWNSPIHNNNSTNNSSTNNPSSPTSSRASGPNLMRVYLGGDTESDDDDEWVLGAHTLTNYYANSPLNAAVAGPAALSMPLMAGMNMPGGADSIDRVSRKSIESVGEALDAVQQQIALNVSVDIGGGGGNNVLGVSDPFTTSSSSVLSSFITGNINNNNNNNNSGSNDRQQQQQQQEINYSLGALIAHGRFGAVYMGLDRDTGRCLAVKTTRAGGENTLRLRQLTREIEILRVLRHKNIVRYYGAEQKGADYHILLEYCSGGSVSQMVRRFGALPEAVAGRYTAQALAGLNYLHSHGVRHRDVKGANLLVTAEGTVKLADFGCASSASAPPTSTSVDAPPPLASSITGTPSYMAPEVVSTGVHTFASDVWSLGVTVLEMVTGRPPMYTNTDVLTMLSRGDDVAPLPENTASMTLSPSLRSFLKLCLAVAPQARGTPAILVMTDWIQSIINSHKNNNSSTNYRR
eukprot:PhM_4_TR8413/c4_g1_i1/m.8088